MPPRLHLIKVKSQAAAWVSHDPDNMHEEGIMGLQSIFHHWQDMRRIAAEIASLDPADLAAMGVTRTDLMEFAQMPADQAARMDRMAAIFGVVQRQLDADPDQRNDILRRCVHCGAKATCESVLEGDDRLTAAEVDFCPNADSYTALANS